jgi:hypothetical protein
MTYGRTKRLALIGMGLCGVLAVLATLLVSGSSEATTSTASEQFSVLEPVSAQAREALPEKARIWLEDTEASSLLGLEHEELVSLGTTSTQAGEVVVAGLGQKVCAYAVDLGVNTCGSINLINEGKLFVVVPSCPTGLIIGVLPDGFRTIQSEGAGETAAGGVSEIPVSSNIYASEIALVETTLSGVAESGDSFTAEAPLGRLGEACE